jgi:photosynthetic reaction center cytochrome c subunit
MAQVVNPRLVENQAAVHVAPAAQPAASADGPKAGDIYQNVKVLGHLSVAEFTRLMLSITAWVSPEQGCTYCHAADNLASDALYTKVVSRRMIEMTQHINSEWKTHVADTGVTCYTCHRGAPVPANVWFAPEPERQAGRMVGNKDGQNTPASSVALASLPYDPFSPYVTQSEDIRVIGPTALPTGHEKSIQTTESTYGLMMHMSDSLGVNCTYCHNSRSFSAWDASTPQRSVSWYGIRMARELNNEYLTPLTQSFPAHRLGATGDVAKLNCATCHQGVNKPLNGAQMLTNYPELAAPRPGAPAAAVPAAVVPAAQAAPAGAVVYFGVGVASVSAGAMDELKSIAGVLQSRPDAKVVVSGYHSASGSVEQNQDLARKRAMAVRDALTTAGIAQDRVVLEKPRAAEANLAGEDPKARRVEVLLQ